VNELDRVSYIIKHLEGKVLDVGYYACTLHKLILEQYSREKIFGIDTETRKETKYYKKASAENIPFKNMEFDTLIAGELVEHLKKPENFFREAKRVLKIGGKLIITTPNKESLTNRLFHNNETAIHYSLFTFPKIRKELAKNGFEIESEIGLPYTIESSEGSFNKWSFFPRKVISYLLPKELQEEIVLTARRIK
jgi:ubiquinone/menaquinone biosynthesis C-methylase UbiE